MAKFKVVNSSTQLPGFDLYSACAALQAQLNEDYNPAWSEDEQHIVSSDVTSPDCILTLLDQEVAQGAEGFHAEQAGVAYIDIQVPDCQGNVTAVMSHELIETLGDWFTNKWAMKSDGTFVPFELCDPVQASIYMKNGVSVSDFVFPDYFVADAPAGSKLDFMGAVAVPFTLAPGGYSMDPQGNVTWGATNTAPKAWRRGGKRVVAAAKKKS